MIPAPSRHPFGHPLPAAALAYFCHPSRPGFTAPVRHPDGTIHAASGYIALRARRGYWLDSDFQPASAEFRERVDRLPWGGFNHAGKHGEWQDLDSVRGRLFRFGVLPLWHGPRTHTADKIVIIAGAPAFPLAILQLLARLPKAEVCVSGTTVHGPVLFRFAGGEGILPCHFRDIASVPAPVFHCLHPRQAPRHGIA